MLKPTLVMNTFLQSTSTKNYLKTILLIIGVLLVFIPSAFNQVVVSGSTVNDANGLTDSDVNGPMVGVSGIFSNITPGDYVLCISDQLGSIGSTPPPVILPNPWTPVGEENQNNNDATADGIMNITVESTAVSGLEFGLNRRPEAEDQFEILSDPGGDARIPVPMLNMTDVEDGTPSRIVIMSVPNQTTEGTLYYGGLTVGAGLLIGSFNPNLLTIDPVDDAGSVQFSYKSIDNALVRSDEAIATMEFVTILPIEYTGFSVSIVNKDVELNWTTSSETNSDYFQIEFSEDGNLWSEVGQIPAAGYSIHQEDYFFSHKAVKQLGFTRLYYRLAQFDLDGNVDYSEIKTVEFEKQIVKDFRLLANPVRLGQDATIIGQNLGTNVRAYDLSGRLVGQFSIENDSSSNSINTQHLVQGMYILLLEDNSKLKLVVQ